MEPQQETGEGVALEMRPWSNPSPQTYALVCGLGAPAMLIVVGTIMAASQRGSLPSPLANHWDSDVVTSTVGLGPFLAMTAFQVLVAAAVTTLLALRMPVAARPTLIGMSVALSTFLGLVGYGIVLGQRGLSAAEQAANPSGSVMGAGLLALIAGIACLHGHPSPDAVVRGPRPPAEAARLSTAAPRSRFVARVTPAAPLAVAYGLVVLVALGLLVFSGADWWLLAAALLLAAGVLSMVMPVVTADAAGVRVRGFGIVPWLSHEAGQLHWADARPDLSLPQGLRHRGGRTTYRVRPGETLELHLHDGSVTVVSLPGAQACAAVVNTLLDDAHRASATPAKN